MSEQELAEIEARAAAAEPGPWRWREREHNERIRKTSRAGRRSREQWVYLLQGPAPDANWEDDQHIHQVMALNWSVIRGTTLSNVGPHPKNAAFIAHSRTDVPQLAAEVRRLRALLEAHGVEVDIPVDQLAEETPA